MWTNEVGKHARMVSQLVCADLTKPGSDSSTLPLCPGNRSITRELQVLDKLPNYHMERTYDNVLLIMSINIL